MYPQDNNDNKIKILNILKNNKHRNSSQHFFSGSLKDSVSSLKRVDKEKTMYTLKFVLLYYGHVQPHSETFDYLFCLTLSIFDPCRR
jgi:hypothetical protein